MKHPNRCEKAAKINTLKKKRTVQTDREKSSCLIPRFSIVEDKERPPNLCFCILEQSVYD